MNRKPFYDHIRAKLTWRTYHVSDYVPRINPFKHRMLAFQVRGMEVLLDEAEKRGWSDPTRQDYNLHWVAYVLATAYWETARTMTAIREYGRGRGKSYGIADPLTGQTYYGRGVVQLTWLPNYVKAKRHLGVDFVSFPDKALEPHHAANIIFEGMEDGWFTGKSLKRYFNPRRPPMWRAARRIVNGQDKATEIALIARVFHVALIHSHRKD